MNNKTKIYPTACNLFRNKLHTITIVLHSGTPSIVFLTHRLWFSTKFYDGALPLFLSALHKHTSNLTDVLGNLLLFRAIIAVGKKKKIQIKRTAVICGKNRRESPPGRDTDSAILGHLFIHVPTMRSKLNRNMYNLLVSESRLAQG